MSKNGPFIKSDNSTNKIMTRLIIALMPIVCFAIFKNSIIVYLYGSADVITSLYPVFMIVISSLTSYLTEMLYYKFTLKLTLKKANEKACDSFAIIPGLLLALVLPINTPLWLVVMGSFIGIIVGKMLYGGFGKNIFNPALIGYLFIAVCYPTLINNSLNLYELDTISSATPLTNFSSNMLGSYDTLITPFGNLLNFFVGTIPGAIGETSKLLILVSFIYLAFTKTIKWKIPAFYVFTVGFLTLIISSINGIDLYYPLFNLLSGGLLFGAVFMATDPVTSPKNGMGQIIYGICLGILTVFIRYLTNYPEGVMTSILFMNMFVSIIDNIGIKIQNSDKKQFITFVLLILIGLVLVFSINNKLNSKEEEKESSVKIISSEKSNNSEIIKVSSKGFGLISATVTVKDGVITNIEVTDHETETQWNEIIKNDYINKVINNQNDIDSLDAVAGSTYSSNALKNIVKEVIK